MKLKSRTLKDLADMICGGTRGLRFDGSEPEPHLFPYRSSSRLTGFFEDCDLDYVHDGTTRIPWVKGVLEELDGLAATQPGLPSDAIIRVIQELMDPTAFEGEQKSRQQALGSLNQSLGRDGLEAYFDHTGLTQVRAGNVTSVGIVKEGAWSEAELKRRERWESYLSTASEDDFTENALAPLLRKCGFMSVHLAGHKDKSQEFGKDVRMKYRLPSGHVIYFAIQVKTGKLDAAGRTRPGNQSITEVLNQVRMALVDPVLDEDINQKVLVDHVMVITTGEITKMAEQFLANSLDISMRRTLLFMGRSKLLDQLARCEIEVPLAF